MNNNEFFKTLLHLTGCSKNKTLILELFALGGEPEISHSQVRGWRADPTSRRGVAMPDWALKAFFAGLFEYRDDQSELGIEVFCFPRVPDAECD
ncbi:hypothetical protein C9426_24010 [Serratia sp. S1B]|nr:hypothetical protein C9426_24010 [Serratia sp. S1B]